MSLSVTNLGVRFKGRDILQEINATFALGKVTVLLGPNGAGKTTLLRALAGLITPHSGDIMLDGSPLLRLPLRARARALGLLPQAADVHWDITVRTLVALGRMPHQGWHSGESAADMAAIEQAMQATDVAHFAARPVRSLSGGERARVLLARVLSGTPRWLLADEPLAHLDLAHQFQVLDIFARSAGEGVGVILVLHDLAQAARIADDVLLLAEGRLRAAGPAASTLTGESLSKIYDVSVDVVQQSDGSLQIAARPRTIR
jgi:iron complex transport system ATP-binding protein